MLHTIFVLVLCTSSISGFGFILPPIPEFISDSSKGCLKKPYNWNIRITFGVTKFLYQGKVYTREPVYNNVTLDVAPSLATVDDVDLFGSLTQITISLHSNNLALWMASTNTITVTAQSQLGGTVRCLIKLQFKPFINIPMPEQSTQVVVRPEMSIPKHRMGCPSTTQEFYNGAWYPLKGYLTQGNTESVMDSEKVTTCGISEPDSLPAGKYCLYKESTASNCSNNFTQDAIIVQTLDSGEFNYSVEYCCSTKGDADTPVTFPAWDGPFYLLPSDRKCQKVVGYTVELQYIDWWVNFTYTNLQDQWKGNSGLNVITLYICSYILQNYWPTGNFGLLRPDEGCAEEIFHRERQDSIVNIDYGSFWLIESTGTTELTRFTFDLCVRSKNKLRQAFPRGRYCVFGQNDICPFALTKETVGVTSVLGDTLVFSLLYCCMLDGDLNIAITLPSENPFYLLQYGPKCQKVEGMDVRRQFLLFRASVLSGFVESSPVNFTNVRTNANKSTITFDVCKYQPSSHVANAPGSAFTGYGMQLGIAFGVLGLFIVILVLMCHKQRRCQLIRRQKNKNGEFVSSISGLQPSHTEKSKLEIGSLLKMALDMDAQLAIYDRLIHPDKMETLGQIGKGAFGTVYQGRYRPDNNPLHAQYVAIKNIKESCTYPEIKAFMEEAIVMAGFRHANVLTMIGVCVHPITHIPTLILPFMEHGDLQKYLRKFRYEDDLKNMTPELHQLLSFCLHIARGMTYLSDMKFVHRDLAARNCMLDNNMVVRVADFGLTRDIYSDSYYRQDKNKLLPIKWMALESIRDRVFNFQTDVWSFGVTVWEIFTLGKVPYPELENIQVLPELERGQRLPKPDTCPVAVHDMVLKCWLENPKERPSFVDIVKSIEANLGEMSEYLDLDKGSENTTGVTDGIVSSHQELAEISNLTARAKMGYDDYREPSLRCKKNTLSQDPLQQS